MSETIKTKNVKVTDLIKGMKIINIGVVSEIVDYANIIKIRLISKYFMGDRDFILFNTERVVKVLLKSDGTLDLA